MFPAAVAGRSRWGRPGADGGSVRHVDCVRLGHIPAPPPQHCSCTTYTWLDSIEKAYLWFGRRLLAGLQFKWNL